MFILVERKGEGNVCIAVRTINYVFDTPNGTKISLNTQDGMAVLEIKTPARQVFDLIINADRQARSE